MKNPYAVLLKPIITEKANQGQTLRTPQYAFEVAIDADKVQIRRAVEECFNVHVVSVNTIRMKGKRKRFRSPKLGKRRDWKKAVVQLVEGQSINLV
ncbi:MAG: 50S ribosomal protein L23 [candidate division BRC1 bacterium ADurb.BinA364]|nr:MAG: 50S ribosomal protein L23 [candidate division BRC1 bacterium ADurb.BinA364]